LIKLKDYSDTTYVTGMRAFAALWVVLIHSGGGGLRSLGVLGNSLADLGRGGVYVFFVISGFSVAASYRAAGGYKRYLFLRFMRLAPLYYFWLLVYGLWLQRGGNPWSASLGVPAWPLDIFLHLTFLHAFYVPAANSFIGVEWSLSVEMFWYLCLPGLLWLGSRGKGLLLPVLGLGVYFLAHLLFDRAARTDDAVRMGLLWDPLPYFFSYALGVWAFVVRGLVSPQDRRGGILFALALLAAYVSGPLWQTHVLFAMVIPVSVVTFLFLVYGSAQDPLCRRLFMPKPVLVLGTLSYGIYLAHLLILHWMGDLFVGSAAGDLGRTLLAALGSVLVAWGTYEAVERPSERWAKRFYPLVNKSSF
jgi:peptidoglycan/LPS O-acetylase OafA/YrhL